MNTEFTTVRTEGGLLPPDLLHRIAAADPDLGGFDPEKYGLQQGDRVGEAASRAWARAKNYWAAFRSATEELPEGESGLTQTRAQWLQPLLRELGYRELQYDAAGEVIDERRFPRYYRSGPVPLHVLTLRQKLDSSLPSSSGQRRGNPHALMQEYLNLSDATYGIVSNGLQLRLLLDTASLTRQAYVEFDLQAMMEGGVYADFVLLYLVLHRSRLPQKTEEAGQSWLELWRARAESQGARALGELRHGVEEAIKALGNGFLAHPANDALRQRLRSGDMSVQDYYQELLRLIYRLIFLFVAEERSLLFPSDADATDRRRYMENYSASRLRDLARKYLTDDRHDDLWRTLRITFGLLSGEKDGMSVPALGGGLFDEESCPNLDGCHLRNDALAEAVRRLSWVRIGRVTRRVNYREMDAEELGGVYEGLLEQQPQMVADAALPRFELVGSGERKQTGSYYTPTSVVQELIKLVLEPTLVARLKGKKTPHEKRETILNITVCDPACGSGHFLLAAARRLAQELAHIDAGDTEPSPPQVRSALRDAISHCIYGVDLNPLAVDLCRLALWLDGHDPGRPLTFLDAHVKLGNSLVGATAELVKGGIPDEAFDPIGDDDKRISSIVKKRNKQEQRQYSLFAADPAVWESMRDDLAIEALEITDLPEDRATQVAEQRERYRSFRRERVDPVMAPLDAWTAAFFWPLTSESPEPPTTGVLDSARPGLPPVLSAGQQREVARLRLKHRFFHWPLEFPEVFADGGFDVVLGNPPWDTLSPDVKEFFAIYEPAVRFQSPEDQRRLVDALLENPLISARWQEHTRTLYSTVKFIKQSGRYRLFAPGNLGKGDFNVYRMFVEAALASARTGGWAAQVVPEGLYNGANAMAIREALFEKSSLAVILGFENTKEVWFKDIDSRTKFCVYAAQVIGRTEAFRTAFGIRSVDQLRAAVAGETLLLPVNLVHEFSPDALAIMELSSQLEVDIATKVYARWPKFGDESAGEPLRHYMREIDMGNDRDLFSETPPGLPVYEGRMVGQFDHRAKGYQSGRERSADWLDFPFGSAQKAILPQWYIPVDKVPEKTKDRVKRFRIGFCDVASPTNERSLIASLIPPDSICGHKTPTITFEPGCEWYYLVWLAVANSMTMDFIARKKVSLTMSYTLLDSLPFPRLKASDPVVERIAPLVLSGASGKSRQLSPTVRCLAGDVADGAVADPI